MANILIESIDNWFIDSNDSVSADDQCAVNIEKIVADPYSHFYTCEDKSEIQFRCILLNFILLNVYWVQ